MKLGFECYRTKHPNVYLTKLQYIILYATKNSEHGYGVVDFDCLSYFPYFV